MQSLIKHLPAIFETAGRVLVGAEEGVYTVVRKVCCADDGYPGSMKLYEPERCSAILSHASRPIKVREGRRLLRTSYATGALGPAPPPRTVTL